MGFPGLNVSIYYNFISLDFYPMMMMTQLPKKKKLRFNETFGNKNTLHLYSQKILPLHASTLTYKNFRIVIVSNRAPVFK